MTPECSVVLASYEGERYIGEQLDSILLQLSPHDEVIVCDDASRDGTLAAVRARSDSRIRISENRERVGYIGNFQRAAALARGELVFFADQDDIWLPGKVATQRAALACKPCVASDAKIVDEALRELHPSYFAYRGISDFSCRTILLRPPIVGATLAIRQRYLATLLPFPAGVPHDFWISFNAAWDDALEIVSAPLILYRRHAAAHSPSGTSRRRRLGTIALERARLLGFMAARRLRGRGWRMP
jgi:glycosyltransferase involved in cell wall biosynthesis